MKKLLAMLIAGAFATVAFAAETSSAPMSANKEEAKTIIDNKSNNKIYTKRVKVQINKIRN